MHLKENRNRVIEWVKTHVCSIAFLQETHIDENIEKEIRNNFQFEIVSTPVVMAHLLAGGFLYF